MPFVHCGSANVRDKNNVEKRAKKGKIGLTKGVGCGNICKLSDERPLRGREVGENHGKIREKEKKPLDKPGGPW